MSASNEPNAGYVYILVNPAIPALVKIGRTVGLPESRAREVSRGTGVPAEFVVAWACPVGDCVVVERLIHEHLVEHRYRSNREFFELPVAEAVRQCEALTVPHRRAIDLVSTHEPDKVMPGGGRAAKQTKSSDSPPRPPSVTLPEGYTTRGRD